MNVRNYLKAAAVALPMALAPMKSSAQSAAKVTENAAKVVMADTTKVAKEGVQDARTVVLKKWDGHFDGSVVNGNIGNGSLKYNEQAKTILADEISPKKTEFDIQGAFIHANGMPGKDAYGLKGFARRGNNEYGVQTIYSSGGGKSNFGGGISYTRDFPLLNNHEGSKLEAFGRLSAIADIRRMAIEDRDHLGIAHLNLVGGLKGNAKVGDFNLGGEAFIGGGESIRIKANSSKKDTYSHFSYGAKLKAGFKNVYAFITGGKAPETNGGYIGAGAGVKF